MARRYRSAATCMRVGPFIGHAITAGLGAAARGPAPVAAWNTIGPVATQVVTYFTKGLDDVALAEVSQLTGGAAALERDTRFALFALPETAVAELRRTARTIDDIRILVAGPAAIDDRTALRALCDEARTGVEAIIAADGRHDTGDWSITVSARNPPWRQGAGWDPAEIVEAALGVDMRGVIRRPVDLRLQVDGERAHLSVSFAAAARPDEQVPRRAGALRSTVAASMVRLAIDEMLPETTRLGLYDPFCGSGTIVTEATHARLPVFGSDIDPDAVRITRERLAALGLPALDEEALRRRIFVHDVAKGFPPRVGSRTLAGNMPWGKQIKIERHQELFDAVVTLVVRVIEDGGSAVFLTLNEDRFIANLRRRARGATVETRRIGLLGQTPAMITVRAGR